MYPAFHVFVYPGAQAFYDDLIPGSAASSVLDPRTRMAIWQLANCAYDLCFGHLARLTPRGFGRFRLLRSGARVFVGIQSGEGFSAQPGLARETGWRCAQGIGHRRCKSDHNLQTHCAHGCRWDTQVTQYVPRLVRVNCLFISVRCQHHHLMYWTAQGGPVGLWFLECNDPR